MKEIPLTQKQVAIVDDHDFEYLMLWKWYSVLQGNHYYAVRTDYCTGKPERVRMDRVVYERMEGRPPIVDDRIIHLDGNCLNNCRSNLMSDLKLANYWRTRRMQPAGPSSVPIRKTKGASQSRRTGGTVYPETLGNTAYFKPTDTSDTFRNLLLKYHVPSDTAPEADPGAPGSSATSTQ